MLEALEQVRQQFTEAKKGFNFKGQHITDPYYDETGRFKVDPKKYYGLSDKQLKDLFKEENDHEVSMARGELEAIADKATQLASMLQGKSDDGNPLEAWVQSKITKAKDYITSVSDYLTYNPDMKQNEELQEARFEVEGRVDYKGISDGDDFSIVVDAPDEKAAEKKVEDMLFTHRNQGKLGPKGGRGVDDYEIESITRTSKSVTNKFSTYQTAEKDLEEAEDYGLKGTITDKQLQNIKSVWSNKTKKDITPGVKAMLAKLDSPTRLAIKMAKINVLSDLVEEINEGFSSSLKQKAKEIAKKFANNMTKAVDEIEKLAKGLSDEPEVYKVIRQYNEDTQRPGSSNPNPKELDEAQSHTVRYTDPLNKKRFAIPYKTHADAEKKMAQLKKDGVKEIEITMDTLKPGIKFKEFKEELEEGIMKDIYTMDKEGASADDIAKRLKINVSTVKKILGEQKEELPVKKDEKKESDDKQNQIASKDKEIESLRGQVSLLKQKVENEKNKAIKPEPNPKTGEVPLTIGIAHAEFKKQKDKEEVKEEVLDEKVADSIIKDLQKAYGDLKGKTISPEMAKKISKHLDQSTYDLDTLRQLQKANIPFISTLARNKIYKKTGKFEEKRLQIESLVALKNKAEKTGMPYNILKQVYDRGMAAWKSGHRPGAGQQQWALARVNSFVTKSSGTWGGADKDLAAKVKGEK
jgi:hypothetical protein